MVVARQIERAARVDDAAAHPVACGSGDGQRLAGQGRLVEHRIAVFNAAVDRNHFAGADEKQVTASDGVERWRRELTVLVTTHRPWCTCEEGTELALGAARRLVARAPYPCRASR